jgi:hypothetical protein
MIDGGAVRLPQGPAWRCPPALRMTSRKGNRPQPCSTPLARRPTSASASVPSPTATARGRVSAVTWRAPAMATARPSYDLLSTGAVGGIRQRPIAATLVPGRISKERSDHVMISGARGRTVGPARHEVIPPIRRRNRRAGAVAPRSTDEQGGDPGCDADGSVTTISPVSRERRHRHDHSPRTRMPTCGAGEGASNVCSTPD